MVVVGDGCTGTIFREAIFLEAIFREAIFCEAIFHEAIFPWPNNINSSFQITGSKTTVSVSMSC